MSQPPSAPGARPLDLVGTAIMLALCLSWGTQQIAIKYALPEVGPSLQAGLRSAGAMLLVALWLRWRGERFLAPDGTFWPGMLAGLLFGLEFLFLYSGLALTTASRAVLFIYTAPFVVAIGSQLLPRADRLSARGWAGTAIAFAGVALALAPWAQTGDLVGDLMCLVAGICWGATTVVIKGSALRSASGARVLQYQLVVSAGILLAAGVALGDRFAWPMGPVAIASLAYQIVWIATITFTIWFVLISRYSATQLSSLTFLVPIIGIASGHWILGEPLNEGFIIAVLLVVAGLVLVTWPARRQ